MLNREEVMARAIVGSVALAVRDDKNRLAVLTFVSALMLEFIAKAIEEENGRAEKEKLLEAFLVDLSRDVLKNSRSRIMFVREER